MFRNFVVLLLVGVFLLGACACSTTRVIGGTAYHPYGLVNKSSEMDPHIQYKPCWPNIALGIVGAPLWFIPTIYVFGFDYMEPVGPKRGPVNPYYKPKPQF